MIAAVKNKQQNPEAFTFTIHTFVNINVFLVSVWYVHHVDHEHLTIFLGMQSDARKFSKEHFVQRYSSSARLRNSTVSTECFREFTEKTTCC